MDKMLQAFVRYLKKYYPDPRGKPVYVRSRKRVTINGSLLYDSDSSRITINKNADYEIQLDALCHEWAHMLDGGGFEDNRRQEHRQSWGREYARIYQAYWDFKNQWDTKHGRLDQR